ncbi:MAG: hypothetical protein LBS47_01355 [Endomicrobium sp.]|nr:hypothetical protein [Endomicrobium sp.]
MLSDCGVTYPKDDIVQDLEKLIKKECKQNSRACILGRTLYLDMEVGVVKSQNQETVLEILRKIHLVSFAMVRVILSGDSDIKYMVTTTYDVDKNIVFRVVKNIDDIKSYFCMCMSRSDYESRCILEIAYFPFASRIITDRHDITDDEYIGRVIVSQIVNIISRSNPISWYLISTLQLHYAGINDKTLILFVSEHVDIKVNHILKNILREQVQKCSKKYNKLFNRVEVVTSTGKTVLTLFL